jgi:hypothetical protein
MTRLFRLLAGVPLAAAASIMFSSCVYDPYVSSSVGTSYSSGSDEAYGDGYGYGGSNFSTSLFVSTGDPRWGYDPNCYSYYDYQRHCYYDPYLSGYYPVGYRPQIVYGCPYPGDWSPGHGYCPPPQFVRNITVVNYQNRAAAYRNSNYAWAKQVRASSYHNQGQSQHTPTRAYQTRNQSYSNGYSHSNQANSYQNSTYRPTTSTRQGPTHYQSYSGNSSSYDKNKANPYRNPQSQYPSQQSQYRNYHGQEGYSQSQHNHQQSRYRNSQITTRPQLGTPGARNNSYQQGQRQNSSQPQRQNSRGRNSNDQNSNDPRGTR